MIILHNSEDKESREFVAQYGAGALVLDWYKGGREIWLAMGGTDKISAFPSVVVEVPEHIREDREPGGGKTQTVVPAVQRAIRKPKTLSDIDSELASVNQHLPANRKINRDSIPKTIARFVE